MSESSPPLLVGAAHLIVARIGLKGLLEAIADAARTERVDQVGVVQWLVLLVSLRDHEFISLKPHLLAQVLLILLVRRLSGLWTSWQLQLRFFDPKRDSIGTRLGLERLLVSLLCLNFNGLWLVVPFHLLQLLLEIAYSLVVEVRLDLSLSLGDHKVQLKLEPNKRGLNCFARLSDVVSDSPLPIYDTLEPACDLIRSRAVEQECATHKRSQLIEKEAMKAQSLLKECIKIVVKAQDPIDSLIERERLDVSKSSIPVAQTNVQQLKRESTKLLRFRILGFLSKEPSPILDFFVFGLDIVLDIFKNRNDCGAK